LTEIGHCMAFTIYNALEKKKFGLSGLKRFIAELKRLLVLLVGRKTHTAEPEINVSVIAGPGVLVADVTAAVTIRCQNGGINSFRSGGISIFLVYAPRVSTDKQNMKPVELLSF